MVGGTIMRQFCLFLLCLFSVAGYAKPPKNLIVVIGDGMGPAHITAYRHFYHALTGQDGPTVFDELLIGSVRTDNVHANQVTDSAASATAYACGFRTDNGALCVKPDGTRGKSLFAYAAEAGKWTGLVVTSQITHATPAAFVAHNRHRRDYKNIAREYLARMADGRLALQVLMGGGRAHLAKASPDWRQLVQQAGFERIETMAALHNYKGNKPVIGVFADEGLAAYLDRRNGHVQQPSLPEMVDKALARLSQNPKGFVLLVEGSQIDWASHDNDIVDTLWETHELALTVQKLRAFVKQQPDTALVITADHETGGLSLGSQGKYEWRPRLVTQANMSLRSVEQAVRRSQKIVVPAPQFEVLQRNKAPLAEWNRLWNQLTVTGWTTTGHTGVDVPLMADGHGRDALIGTHDNDALGRLFIRWQTPSTVHESAHQKYRSDLASH